MKNKALIISAFVFFGVCVNSAGAESFLDNLDVPDVSIQKNPSQTKIQIKDNNDGIFESDKDDMELKFLDKDDNNSKGKGKSHGKKKDKFKLFMN